MSFNDRDEAVRVRDIAEDLMKKSNFPKALKLAVKAQQLDSSLYKISHMIMLCEVHCRATQNFFEIDKREKDWYGILHVEPEADADMIKKQYKKLALLLHPDKNKFPGASDAFKLVQEAYNVLMDDHKRSMHDLRRQLRRQPPPRPPPPPQTPKQTPSWTPDWMSPKHPPTASSSTAKNNRKRRRKRVIIESSSSSDSESNSDIEEEYVVFLSDDDDIQGVEEKKQTQEEGNQTQEEDVQDSPTRIVFYNAADFRDFDKLRGNNCFEKDQLWAVYDEEEAMPRYYAIITEVRPVDFMLKYAWLEVDKDNGIGRPNLPVSVGKFEVGDTVESNTCANFSHLVCSNIGRRLTRGRKFTVFPKKGETWALFKNWDILIKSTESVSPEYEFGEILSDHVEGTKISVGFLSKLEGYKCVFCPMPNGNSCEILQHEFCRFSHGVPSFRLTGKEGRGVTEGCFELDPAALPA